MNEIGKIKSLHRYLVKSMAGEEIQTVELNFHGLESDRRFAFRRTSDNNGFPWLTAGKLPELILFKPFYSDDNTTLFVQTPTGEIFDLKSPELQTEISTRFGSEVEIMKLNQGIFDEAPVSVISLNTILKIGTETGRNIEIQRFRPNIVLDLDDEKTFQEDSWVGKNLVLGESQNAPEISITLRDQRCAMINLDPKTAKSDPGILKSVVSLNQNNAGVYGTVIKTGQLVTGQKIFLKTIEN